jgi:hypothetical protein
MEPRGESHRICGPEVAPFTQQTKIFGFHNLKRWAPDDALSGRQTWSTRPDKFTPA